MQSSTTTPLTHLSTATAHLRGLLVSEWRLAKLELARNLRAARVGVILAAIGLGGALCAMFALTGALFLGLGALGLAPWLAALATAGALGLIAAICLWLGLTRLSPEAIAPTETVAHAAKTLRIVTENTHVS
ncbi:phage holin family protein [uncultured Tateyamaria sp.]|uniref:phage holin family protein n=1 Tax=uncultured Tateyamaria sp. TaxID=455651 RepID=UPI002613D3FC|nr:phage holin family protein [uncultured Tateyamaria sp.]